MSLLLHRQKRQPELIRSVSYPYNRHRGNTAQSSSAGGIRLVAGFILVSALVGLAVWGPRDNKNPINHAAAQVAGARTDEPEPIKQLDFTIMNHDINQVIQATTSMDVGVSIIDIKTGHAMNYGEQSPFEAASTAKLLTAIAYLSDVEQGAVTLDSPVGSRTAKAALEALIVESDNAAWDAFNNHVMTHAELAAYANKIGFDGYDPDRNTVTPASLARLLNNLYARRLLNDEHTTLLLSYMQRAKEVEYITSIIPNSTKIYHKPGYLVDRVHDATIIDNGSRPYVLVIFSKSHTKSYDSTVGQSVFQQITRSTLSAFAS